jgi:hypothetical protein
MKVQMICELSVTRNGGSFWIASRREAGKDTVDRPGGVPSVLRRNSVY